MEENGVRINKFLSEAGVCSRREADRQIEAGKVGIDGVTAKTGDRVLKGQTVTYNGQVVSKEEEMILIALNKPAGIVCTAEKREKNNVIDYLNYPKRIYPIGWLLIFNTLIAGLITSFINAKLLEPITRLSKAMKEVSRGDFEQHLETNSRIAEVGESYQSFNVMTKELRATEVLQMNFVSDVSHEFKTPINAIEGYTMLLQGEELSPDQEEYVEKILFNTQRLSGLVGNILLLSKLENQNIPMKKTEYRLDEQIRQAFLSLETKWTEKEIGFQVELEEVKYTGNEGLFMHIWINLLDNAIKFSPSKGTITMFLKQEQDSVKFILEDEGPGIEDDVKSRIFDKFYQVDGSHKAEGNGLGLALVKRIVDSAGGTIKAENREYGGCRFVVELPIQKDEAI